MKLPFRLVKGFHSVAKMVRYDTQYRRLIASCILGGAPTAEIVETLRVSKMTVSRYRRNLSTFGVHDPPLQSIGHRPRKIHLSAQEALRELLAANGTMMLDEVQDWLLEEWDIDVHISNISRCLKTMKVTHKRIEKVNPDADPVLQAHWLAKVATRYTASQLVVVDESAANERTADRRWGWSPKGVACRQPQSGVRSSRWSILPAIGINGYLEYEIFHGSFNSERFENFIRKLLRKMTPFPGPRSVLIMDNVSTHHSPYVRELCRQAGVVLEYLPPYSPHFSPIEESFSVLKAWIRRNRTLAEPLKGCFQLFLEIAVAKCNFKRTARGFFGACGIHVSDEDEDVDYDSLLVEEDLVELRDVQLEFDNAVLGPGMPEV